MYLEKDQIHNSSHYSLGTWCVGQTVLPNSTYDLFSLPNSPAKKVYLAMGEKSELEQIQQFTKDQKNPTESEYLASLIFFSMFKWIKLYTLDICS
jgi:hypothetical protein